MGELYVLTKFVNLFLRDGLYFYLPDIKKVVII